nr:hypothetical protein [Acholeplasmatales bacterium]
NNMKTVKRDSQKVTQIDLSYMNYSCEYKYTHDKHFGYSSRYKSYDETTRTNIKISKLDDSNYEELRTKFITKCKKNNCIIDKSTEE